MIQINRTMDYALRSLVYLGIHGNGDLGQIASQQHIPQSYLAKVMKRLAQAGIVRSTLGREGGYSLRLPPDHITLFRVFEAVEGTFALFDCYQGDEECFFLGGGCILKNHLGRLELEIIKLLEQTTLADMLNDARLAEEIHDNNYVTRSPAPRT